MIKHVVLSSTLLAALFAFETNARAQVPYIVTQEPDPYTTLFNGTFLNFFDFNNGEVQVALPFPFRYFLDTYNTLNVGTNGFVSFNEAATANSNTAFPTFNPPNNIIALFWDDLWAGDVTTHLEGNAPNRIFVVQYRNMQTNLFFGETFEMQLWLHEGNDGRFEIHYGPSRGLTNPPVTASLGFEGAGDLGHNFLPCNPSCTGADFVALQDQAFKATLEGGTDVSAFGITANVRGSPLQIYQAIPFEVESSIASYHGENLGPFTYSVYLLGQHETSPSTPPIFTSGEISLAPYELVRLTDSVTVPVDVSPGRYRVALEVDSSGQINEPLETNNLAIGSQALLVGARAADLRVSDLSIAPGSVLSPGSTFNIALDIENAGNLEASADYRIVLSQNRAPSVNDVIIGVSASPEELPLASGPIERTVSVTIPANIQAGQYYFGAVIDPLNTVAELNETNNTDRISSPIDIEIPSVEIVTTSLPAAYLGNTYQARLVASGGNGIYAWELIGGDTPDGLTFAAGSAGEIRGTPTALSSGSLTFRVTSNGLSAEKTLMFDVREIGGPLTIVNRNLLTGIVGQPYPPADANQGSETQQRITAVGGDGDATFTLVSGGPTGLTLDADGYLHGVPVSRGLYSLEVSATDGTNSTTRRIPLTIVEPGRLSLIVGAAPDAQLGEPYSYELFVVGQTTDGTLSYEFLDALRAPPGLSMNSTDGIISGTPTLAGLYTFGVRVIEGSGANAAEDTASVTILVSAGEDSLSITPSSIPDAVIGVEYSVTFEARQGLGPFVWTIENPGGLPPGLELATVDVDGIAKLRLFGTPTDLPGESQLGTNTGGVVSFLIRLNDAQGRRAEQSASLRVLAAPVTNPDEGGGGCGCSATGSKNEGSLLFAGLFLGIAGLALASLRRK
jgi:hypothetical protein